MSSNRHPELTRGPGEDVAARNTAKTVAGALTRLHDLGIVAALFGGWAEEAHGLSTPGPHRDIDLVVEACNFGAIDKLFASGSVPNEIVGKRFHHKRAFVHAETMVEIYLVERGRGRPVTWFWGDTEHFWLQPLTAEACLHGHRVRTVTAENLVAFRRSHKNHQPWRWKEPGSRVPSVAVDRQTRLD